MIQPLTIGLLESDEPVEMPEEFLLLVLVPVLILLGPTGCGIPLLPAVVQMLCVDTYRILPGTFG